MDEREDPFYGPGRNTEQLPKVAHYRWSADPLPMRAPSEVALFECGGCGVEHRPGARMLRDRLEVADRRAAADDSAQVRLPLS